MSHLRAYIAACEGFGWAGGSEFETRIVTVGRRERRNANWEQPRHKFTLPFLNIGASDYASIKQMHLTCRAKLHGFLYRDRLDSTADAEQFGVGDGVEDTFQLSKLSVVDGVSYQRNVYALYAPDAADPATAVESTPTITIDGTPTAAFTVDPDRGEVVFDTPPANGAVLRWSGSFSIWVRFDQDWLPFSIDNRRGNNDYARNGQVDLIEIPEPDPSSS